MSQCIAQSQQGDFDDTTIGSGTQSTQSSTSGRNDHSPMSTNLGMLHNSLRKQQAPNSVEHGADNRQMQFNFFVKNQQNNDTYGKRPRPYMAFQQGCHAGQCPHANAYAPKHMQQERKLKVPHGVEGRVFRGQLKFFYDSQDYGFLICRETGKDVFFHFDDMAETLLTRYHLIMGSNKPNIAANIGRIRMTVLDEVERLTNHGCQKQQLNRYSPANGAQTHGTARDFPHHQLIQRLIDINELQFSTILSEARQYSQPGSMPSAAALSTRFIAPSSQQYLLVFDFEKLAYHGRYGLSFKAINIKLVDVILPQHKYYMPTNPIFGDCNKFAHDAGNHSNYNMNNQQGFGQNCATPSVRQAAVWPEANLTKHDLACNQRDCRVFDGQFEQIQSYSRANAIREQLQLQSAYRMPHFTEQIFDERRDEAQRNLQENIQFRLNVPHAAQVQPANIAAKNSQQGQNGITLASEQLEMPSRKLHDRQQLQESRTHSNPNLARPVGLNSSSEDQDDFYEGGEVENGTKDSTELITDLQTQLLSLLDDNDQVSSDNQTSAGKLSDGAAPKPKKILEDDSRAYENDLLKKSYQREELDGQYNYPDYDQTQQQPEVSSLFSSHSRLSIWRQ